MDETKTKKPKSIGLLIGIGGGPKRGEPEGDDTDELEDDGEDEDEEAKELKVKSMKAFLSAVKEGDPEAMLEAYEALKECY